MRKREEQLEEWIQHLARRENCGKSINGAGGGDSGSEGFSCILKSEITTGHPIGYTE